MEWSEVLADPSLQDLPYKIETNEYGKIVMSPASRRHSRFQTEIAILLAARKSTGRVQVEAPVQTSLGVKVPDVVWFSDAFDTAHESDVVFSSSPELCVEVISPSNSAAEFSDKRSRYFAAGAIEVWECDLTGRVRFYNTEGEVADSTLFPGFPLRIT
jgi:Uma2 family endonuclease